MRATPLPTPRRSASRGAQPAPATTPAVAPDVAPPASGPSVSADTLDSERILELPTRRVTQPLAAAVASSRRGRTLAVSALASSQMSEGSMSAGSSGMLALGAAAQGYINALRPIRHPDDANSAMDAKTTAATNATSAAGSAKTPGRRAPRPRPPVAPDVCERCGGAGYVRLDVPVGDPSFGQAVACACKERLLEDRRMSDLRRMSSLDAFRDKTFDTFDTALPGVREALDVARRYAEDPHGWLVLSGGYGVGKTHLAAAIAHERLANGQSVFFSIVPDLLDHLRAAFAPSSEMPYDELFDKVREAGVLVLDDLGAENATAWATEKLFQIINYRYNYRMPTVVTTNNRLLAHMDERIRSRLSDMSFVRNVAIDAADYRERHAGRPRQARPSTNQTGHAGQASAPRNTRGSYQR